jgi:cell division protein FtsL
MGTRKASGKPGVTLWGVMGQLLPAALLCALFAGVGIVHVSSRVLVVRTGYTLSTLEQESRELQRENDRLKLELATLKSPSRLEQVARAELRMGPPGAGAVFTLQKPGAARLGRTPPAGPRASEPRVAERTAP